MKRLRALSAWSDDHPVLSFLIGWIVLTVIVLTMLPADPPYLDQPQHMKGTT